MIEVHDLKKRFGEVIAVDGISLRAKDGEVTALLGPNGAGKTTTLRAIYGLIKPDSGQVSIDGIDVVANPMAAQMRIGALPEARGAYPRLTAREHVQYFARLQGLTERDSEQRCEELMERLGMGEIADRRTEGFSHGERTKVALARALVHGPQNVLLDEPTSGLDVMSTRAIRGLVRHLSGEGKCILLSSHLMHEVSAVCDSIVIVADGRVVARGTPDDLRALTGCESLEDAFVSLTADGGATE
ncbi:MAG: ATP-binding cassette domain-containing protein [Bryobacterales bacterium]|nr:ATP-binding cassette domain-containing protein [Bryobacterales bacterium]